MAVLERSELEQSPLADLHAIASELGIEGYRRLRRDDLIEALLSGEAPASSDADREDSDNDTDSDDDSRSRTRTRGGRGRGGSGRRKRDEDDGGDDDDAPRPRSRRRREEEEEDDTRSRGRSRGGRGRGGRSRDDRDDDRDRDRDRDRDQDDRDDRDDEDVEEVERTGVLDILPNGSGFLRVELFRHSAEDVYVSPAQIRRCELRSGDQLTGPVRPPRRSERHPSLVRVDKVNQGEPEPPAERPRFEDLVPVFATAKLPAPDGLDAAPFGRGSRVAVGGPAGAGVTSLLRDIVDSLKGVDDLDLVVVLAGVRPEEVTEWNRLEGVTVAGGGFDRSVDEQAQIADLAVERAKRIVERGGHAALVVDTLDALPPGAARRVFGAARSVEDGGSLTVIAATGLAGEPQRVATTRIVLEPGRQISGSSSTLRAELLS